MYRDKKILGLIPARGGSKGLPGKNIRPLMGKPLICWTVEAAQNSSYLDKIYVSTDSQEILDATNKCGLANNRLRPDALAKDTSGVIDTIVDTLTWLSSNGETYDMVALLEPTSPLRKSGDIDRGIEMMANSDADSVISVGEIALEHPDYAKVIKNGRVESYIEAKQGMRQDLPTVYFPYGVLYLTNVPYLLRERKAYGGRILALPIERWQNYEINDICDFMCVESIMKARRDGIVGEEAQ